MLLTVLVLEGDLCHAQKRLHLEAKAAEATAGPLDGRQALMENEYLIFVCGGGFDRGGEGLACLWLGEEANVVVAKECSCCACSNDATDHPRQCIVHGGQLMFNRFKSAGDACPLNLQCGAIAPPGLFPSTPQHRSPRGPIHTVESTKRSEQNL